MTDNIHIIAYEDDLLSRVACAMQEKGLNVSCSGCAPDLVPMLEQKGVMVGSLQQVIAAGRKVNYVVSPATGSAHRTDAETEYAETFAFADCPGVGLVYDPDRK